MKLLVDNFKTDIYLNENEVRELCLIGHRENTCSWLVCEPNGFRCVCLNKPHSLLKRHMEKSMVALRDGCDFVNNLNVVDISLGTHEVNPFE